jgi:hypothetical protein
MSIVYDYYTLETGTENAVQEIFDILDRTSKAAAPGAYLVELFPWMLHIPERSVLTLMWYLRGSVVWPCFRFARRKYEGSFKQANTLFESLFNRVRSDLVGVDVKTISRNLLN